MKASVVTLVIALFVVGSPGLIAGTPRDSPTQAVADSQLSSRLAISAGMGVEYLSAPHVVDFINALVKGYAVQRVSEFRSAVQFFGAVAYPLSPDWVLKAEYLYLLASYNPDVGVSSDFTLTVHMPSVIFQYVLWDEGLYDLKVGGGIGYHIATLADRFLTIDDRLTGRGLGVVADLEGNTAFGDHLFAYLGGDMRWEFIGTLKSSSSGSQTSGIIAAPAANGFGIGARLGLSYYF